MLNCTLCSIVRHELFNSPLCSTVKWSSRSFTKNVQLFVTNTFPFPGAVLPSVKYSPSLRLFVFTGWRPRSSLKKFGFRRRWRKRNFRLCGVRLFTLQLYCIAWVWGLAWSGVTLPATQKWRSSARCGRWTPLALETSWRTTPLDDPDARPSRGITVG